MLSRFAKVLLLVVAPLSVCVSVHAQTLSSETYTIEKSTLGQPYESVEGVNEEDVAPEPEEGESENESRTPITRRERELLKYFDAATGGTVFVPGATDYVNAGNSLWPGIVNNTNDGSQDENSKVLDGESHDQNLESGFVVPESHVIEPAVFQKHRAALLLMFLLLCALITFRVVGVRMY